MLTKIDLCSLALLKLGEKPIQSFTEDTTNAQLARTFYEPVIDSLLSSHPWRFAIKNYSLTKTLQDNFLIPVDVLRILGTSANTYSVIGDRIHAAANKLEITAIARCDSSKFPSHFVTVASTKLAMEFCIPMSENQNMYRTLSAALDSEMHLAKFIDSTSDTNDKIASFSLLSSRF